MFPTEVNDLINLPFMNITEAPTNLPNWLSSQGVSRDQINLTEEHDNHSLALEAAVAGHGGGRSYPYFLRVGILLVESWSFR